MRGVDFDHTSFAVHDATMWARRLRRELGATPIAGESLPAFRYLLLHVGSARSGARVELIEPAGDGFLTRYLARHGEGPHHITFMVPDLRATVREVRALGGTVTGEDYEKPSWQEAFVLPDRVHGVVIQLAQSTRSYPPTAELLATRQRDTGTFPSSRGATDPTWWTTVWDTPVDCVAELGATHLGSTDMAFSLRLFHDVLGADVCEHEGGVDLQWPSGAVRLLPQSTPGIVSMTLDHGPLEGFRIGPTPLLARMEGSPA